MLFLHPAFLWLLPLSLLPFFGGLWKRDRIHALLRMAVLALVVLALARPARIAPEKDVQLFYLRDQSASISADEAIRADHLLAQAAKTLPRGSATTTLPIGGEAAVGSPVGATLAHALREQQPDSPTAIVIASDGLATAQDWGEAAQQILDRGIPVSVVPLAHEEQEVRVVGLEADGLLRQGQPARLLVSVAGEAERARVSLHRETVEGEVVALSAWMPLAGRREFALSFEAEQAGFLHLVAVVESEAGVDLRAEDNLLARPFAVQDPLRVLHLGRRLQGNEQQLSKLLGPGFTFVHEGDPAAFPLVWLDDAQADEVPAAFQEQLVSAVKEQGTGLMMSGSAAFGPGGWTDTPVEDLLPVSFVQKEEKRDPSTTLCIIIDTSGSMGGNRVQLAKEVARLAINRLLPHDKVGIVEFYGAKRWAAPIQPASNRIELERALNRLDAGGGTVILPAIEEAWYGMKNVNTRYKHVLVLTDGGVETGPFESILRRMADDGMNVSTVLIGPETHSEFLVNLANWGKGRFYNVPNRFNLPEVILKQPASARLPAYRPGPHQVQGRGGLAWWSMTDVESLPPLSGYVETEARPGAEVLLETADGGHPVLASWRDGLGRVSAMTASAVGEDTAGWQDWPAFGTMLAQALARTAGEADRFHFSLARYGRETVLTALRTSPHQLLPTAQVVGQGTSLSFLEVAPDLFEARFPSELQAEVRLHAGVAGQAFRQRAVAAAVTGRTPELQVDPVTALSLSALALQSGGLILKQGMTEPLPRSQGIGKRLAELAPWFLALALLLFLAELAWRRRPQAPGPLA